VSIYRTPAGEHRIRDWCRHTLAARLPDARSCLLDTPLGPTHITRAGESGPPVVLVPGTNFNAATSIPLVSRLAARHRVTVLDVPGQPGLSTGVRPSDDRVRSYRAWLDHVLATLATEPVVLVGESLGAAVALCATPGPRVRALVTVAPAGLDAARLSGAVLAVSLLWLLRPTPLRSHRLLTAMSGGASIDDQDHLAEWLTLAARDARTSLAPRPLPGPVFTAWRTTPRYVLVGARDPFFPPRRLGGPVTRLLGTSVTVLPGCGHLVSHQDPDAVTQVVSSA
jgi:pimeloyl-ACP methyl ester carboxylesterase